jgi:hypothetical protein
LFHQGRFLPRHTNGGQGSFSLAAIRVPLLQLCLTVMPSASAVAGWVA